MSGRANRTDREAGAVLLVVLVALALLAALAGVALRTGQAGLQGLAAERAEFSREVLAQSALAAVGAGLARPLDVPRDGSSQVLSLPGGVVEARVQAAEGLVNPAHVRLPLLRDVLRALGASPEQAQRLARAIGAARARGRITGPADTAPLFAAEPALWDSLRPYLTYLGQRTTVDAATAPQVLRFALANTAMAAVDLAQTDAVKGFYEIWLRRLAPGETPETAKGRFTHYAVLRDRAGRMHVIWTDWPQEISG